MKQSLFFMMVLCLWLCPLRTFASGTTVKEEMEWLHERFSVNFIYDSSLELAIPYTGKSMAEIASGEGTVKERLANCLDLLFNGTGITWEKNRKYIILTTENEILEEARITDSLCRRVNSTQTGRKVIEGVYFRQGFAALSAPDVIRSLQELPGVAGGTELLTGLYVRGGTGSDNLYALDGIPLYGVSHLAGLYSSFNTEIIDKVEFYKSGFPARYGGRLSSVADVSVKDGDMNDHKGSFTVGLINGAFQMEGPLVKERTSFNVALRRSWLDVLSIPAFALYRRLFHVDSGISARYAMTDLNAKITHRLAEDSWLRLNVYAGRDVAGYAMKSEDYKLRWGNVLASLSWDAVLGDDIRSDMKLYYTRYRSRMDWNRFVSGRYDMNEDFRSMIHDIGFKAGFEKVLSPVHHLRFGAVGKMYIYAPEVSWSFNNLVEGGAVDSSLDSYACLGNETALYLEDEITPKEWISVNLGLRAVLFSVEGKAYARLEPRAAIRMKASDAACFKVSYSEMNQFSHRLVTSYIDLPSSIWMPSTADTAPMHSRQMTVGAYFSLPENLSLDMEIFYKTLDHIREYKGYRLFPSITDWEQTFVPGKGRAYGLEMGIVYEIAGTRASVYYTLSKSERLFEDLYPSWFPDVYDNRNRLNMSVNHRFNRKFEMYGGWTYHTGNRMTIQSQYIPNQGVEQYSFHTSPNNAILPDYHRLDIGFNFHRMTKGGNKAVWNLSVYNLYCRMNPMFMKVRYDDDGRAYYKATGIIPVVPTFSYTLRF